MEVSIIVWRVVDMLLFIDRVVVVVILCKVTVQPACGLVCDCSFEAESTCCLLGDRLEWCGARRGRSARRGSVGRPHTIVDRFF